MHVIPITSDTVIRDAESHFKVSAGPGAGKTHWLANHIKNVLCQSVRLYSARKIGCITYTNIAVETIVRRLAGANQVEVTTIHSFLYNHIVKPYVSFIASKYSLNVSDMNGHDDFILSGYSFLTEWKNRTGQQRIRDDKIIIKAFKNLKWKFDNGELMPKTDYPFKADGYPIKKDSYFEYKKMTWEKGIVHHDDVLFFSYQIVKDFPFVATVLNAKFPYLFIDEFQDSNPIQIEILKMLSAGCVIGVVGDVVQSIYGFQGADYSQFIDFTLSGMKTYLLSENRRSSNEIIDVLNSIRKDLTQTKYRNISNEKPTIYIGDMILALRDAKNKVTPEKIYTLSRDNITSNAMKAEINGVGINSMLLENLKEIDSNVIRSGLMYACIRAVVLARANKFKEAIKELEYYFNYKTDKIKGRRKAINYISFLLENYNIYKNRSLKEFSEIVRNGLDLTITKVSSGAVKTFYENNPFYHLQMCVSVPDDVSLHKTIHKAKGDEFNNILLVLKQESDLDFLLNPDLLSKTERSEEHRINYVAISRAKNRLFISVPSLNNTYRVALQQYFCFKDA